MAQFIKCIDEAATEFKLGRLSVLNLQKGLENIQQSRILRQPSYVFESS